MLANMLVRFAIQLFLMTNKRPTFLNFIYLLFDCVLRRMSESEAAACLAIVLLIDDDDQKNRGPTRGWIRRRKQEGMYAKLVLAFGVSMLSDILK